MKRSAKLSHVAPGGEMQMVDVGSKPIVVRTASAQAVLVARPATIQLLKKSALPKGDVLAAARIAGIQAAKKTAELIPLCHTLPLEHVAVDFVVGSSEIRITTRVRTSARTGVEMEALTAASIAALTLYDMMKAVDSEMVIGEIRVTEKIKE
ncbi:MAG: cyclic pyranopterin monophosphate synthase MoaC [Terrimicrobiaceae bacterium]|nr:cyclic pyranopterin monophosphate synthase MoaC [Terrimicrobiaceae bacterium]